MTIPLARPTMKHVIATEGPDVPASPAFRRCPGCNSLFYEAEHACARCRYRFEVQRPTCAIAYCIDCGWTVPVRNQHAERRRCAKCWDLYVFNNQYVPRLVEWVERIEREGRPDSDRDFLDRLAYRVAVRTEERPSTPCRVPTCDKPRIYASAYCMNHDEDLNGRLAVAVPDTKTDRVGRCVFCRIWVKTTELVTVCPFHNVETMMFAVRWDDHRQCWTRRCPVCFRRYDAPHIAAAWTAYVEHHLLKHKGVALT